MTLKHRLALCALCAMLLCSCAPQANLPTVDTSRVGDEAKKQQELAMRDYMSKLDRMDRVGWTVRSANVELCGDMVSYRLGMNYAVAGDFPKDHRLALSSVLGVGERLTIYQVTPGAPAKAAGIRQGDVLLAVDGKPVANKKEAQDALDKALVSGAPVLLSIERAAEKSVEQASGVAGATPGAGVQAERIVVKPAEQAGNPAAEKPADKPSGKPAGKSGQRLEFAVTPARLCGYELVLKQSSLVNAFADGKNITIYTGMMKFVQTDDELAAIVGHELAHNNQGHIKAKQNNALIGALLFDLPIAILTGVNPNVGSQVGASAYSQEFEAEADYVGLYFTARAGYDIQSVPDIWRRMAVENPGAITMGSTHPSTSARFVALEAAATEIENKRKAGSELRPEMKGAQTQAKKDAPKEVSAAAPQ